MSLIVSAPGKVHLMGEHAVVYGKPALLASISRRLYVEVSLSACPSGRRAGKAGFQNSEFIIQNSDNILIKNNDNPEFIHEIVNIFKAANGISQLPPLEITITSRIPIGSGFGSSAALSSALIGALMKALKNIWNPMKINELAYEAEKKAHGNPSGADNTTVVFGGLVWFRREFDFLKSMWNLPVKSYKIPKLVFINTGRPVESTKEMVEKVGEKYKRETDFMEKVFGDQERQTKNVLLALKTGNTEKLKEAVIKAERNLEKMGVVGSYSKKIIREIEAIGGAAKICGGGGYKKGSGMVLCYHQDLLTVKKIARRYKLSVSFEELGGEGIRIEKDTN